MFTVHRLITPFSNRLKTSPATHTRPTDVDINFSIFEFNPLRVHTMNLPPLAIGCDHAGFEYKELIKRALQDEGYTVHDKGTHSLDSVDYPDFVHPVAEAVESGACRQGILICGSANGVAITANKHQGIRAAIAWRNDLAALARQHNDANILCLPARFITIDEAQQFVRTFLATAFEGGRHAQRVGKIPLQHC